MGGRGMLLGGVPSVAAGRVMVIGGGVVGQDAAEVAIGMGAEVYVLDATSTGCVSSSSCSTTGPRLSTRRRWPSSSCSPRSGHRPSRRGPVGRQGDDGPRGHLDHDDLRPRRAADRRRSPFVRAARRRTTASRPPGERWLSLAGTRARSPRECGRRTLSAARARSRAGSVRRHPPRSGRRSRPPGSSRSCRRSSASG